MTDKPAQLDQLKSRYEAMIGFTPPKIVARCGAWTTMPIRMPAASPGSSSSISPRFA